MKRWHIISVLLFSYFFFLIAGIPASRVLNYAQQAGALPIKLNGINGSIWQGHADSVHIPGQSKLENLDWKINPFAIFIARLSSNIDASFHKQPIHGTVSTHLINHSVYANDVTTKLPAKIIQQMIGLPLGELGGEFEILLDSLYWPQNGMLPQIKARIYWQNAKLVLAQTVDLGQVNIDALTDDTNQTHITIANTGGDLAANGDINLGTDRSYTLNITMKPKDATGDVAQSLNMFAQRQADGSYKLKQSGNLRQLGF